MRLEPCFHTFDLKLILDTILIHNYPIIFINVVFFTQKHLFLHNLVYYTKPEKSIYLYSGYVLYYIEKRIKK